MKVYKLKPLNITNKKKNEGGYNYLVLFEKSHLSICTWPISGTATFDYFSYDHYIYNIIISNKKIN